MSTLSVSDARLQLDYTFTFLNRLIAQHSLSSDILFIIYLGQFLSLKYSKREQDTVYVGAKTVSDTTQDSTLVSIVKLRNALIHYNQTSLNTCVKRLSDLNPEDYASTDLYAYMCYLSEINLSELKQLYNNLQRFL